MASSRPSIAEFRGAVIALMLPPAIGPGWWFGAAFVAIATNLADFATAPEPGAPPGAGYPAATVLRVLLVFGFGYALTRRMGAATRPFRLASFLVYALFSMVLASLFGLAARLIQLVLPLPWDVTAEWLLLFVETALWALLLVRLNAWSAALALDERIAALPRLWRRQSRRTVPIAAALVGLVLPLGALHLALALVVMRLALPGGALAAIGILDGLVSAVQLIATAALSVAAWRLARGDLPSGGSEV